MTEALPFYRSLSRWHHAAMLSADVGQALALRKEAHLLAEKLNGFEPGILADEDAPGCVAPATRAPAGTVPPWARAVHSKSPSAARRAERGRHVLHWCEPYDMADGKG